MTVAESKPLDFKTELKKAVLESLTERQLITPVEKKALEQKNLSSK